MVSLRPEKTSASDRPVRVFEDTGWTSKRLFLSEDISINIIKITTHTNPMEGPRGAGVVIIQYSTIFTGQVRPKSRVRDETDEILRDYGLDIAKETVGVKREFILTRAMSPSGTIHRRRNLDVGNPDAQVRQLLSTCKHHPPTDIMACVSCSPTPQSKQLRLNGCRTLRDHYPQEGASRGHCPQRRRTQGINTTETIAKDERRVDRIKKNNTRKRKSSEVSEESLSLPEYENAHPSPLFLGYSQG